MAETAARATTALFTGGLSEVARPFTKNLAKIPTPPEAPKAPGPDTKAVQTATQEAALRRSKARGFLSTILSQPSASPDLKSTYGS
jgi:hypothetical protein